MKIKPLADIERIFSAVDIYLQKRLNMKTKLKLIALSLASVSSFSFAALDSQVKIHEGKVIGMDGKSYGEVVQSGDGYNFTDHNGNTVHLAKQEDGSFLAQDGTKVTYHGYEATIHAEGNEYLPINHPSEPEINNPVEPELPIENPSEPEINNPIEPDTGHTVAGNAHDIDELEAAFSAQVEHFNGEINRLDDRIDGTQASLHAVINARPYASEGEFSMGMGVGAAGSQQAFAMGLAYGANESVAVSATINADTTSDVSGGAGVQINF